MDETDWPFQNAQNTATFVTRHVMKGEPICYAYRDWDDGAWQFLPDRVTRAKDAMIVCLREVYEKDRTIGSLADLPEGWMAQRDDLKSPWVRQKNHPFPVHQDDGFYLDIATEYERLYPEKFSIPPAEVRENLQVGQMVKLIFRFAGEWSPRLDNDCERMWVEVREVDEENIRYRGTLANDPRLHSEIAYGHELWFHPIHVFDVEKGVERS